MEFYKEDLIEEHDSYAEDFDDGKDEERMKEAEKAFIALYGAYDD